MKIGTTAEMSTQITEGKDIQALKIIAKWLTSEYSQFRDEEVKLQFFAQFKKIVGKSTSEALAAAYNLVLDDDNGYGFFLNKIQKPEAIKAIVDQANVIIATSKVMPLSRDNALKKLIKRINDQDLTLAYNKKTVK